MCLNHRADPGGWQDGSVSHTRQPSPGCWLTRTREHSRDARGHIPPHSSAERLDTFSWAGAGLGAMARQEQKPVLLQRHPESCSISQHQVKPGFLPSDSCPQTDAAGAWLCREQSHVSPLRESLIHAKKYTSLDLRRGICTFSLTPRLFSSLPVPNPTASAVWAHHARAAAVPTRGSRIYGWSDVPQTFKVPRSHLKFHSRRGKGKIRKNRFKKIQ